MQLTGVGSGGVGLGGLVGVGVVWIVGLLVAGLGVVRLFPGLELRAFQLFDLTAEAFGQQFFFIFISRERVALPAQRLIGPELLAIARKLRLQLAESVQIAQMLPLIEQVLSVVLAVDIEQQCAQCAQLRCCDRDAADTAGRFALRCDLAADDEFIIALDLVFFAQCLTWVGIERRTDDCLLGTGAHQFARGTRAEARVLGVH